MGARSPQAGDRRRTRRLQAVVLTLISLLVALCATASVSFAGENEIPAAPACKRGEALERLGRLDAAEAAYLEDLKTEPGVTCADAKLAQLGRRETRCNRAKALAAAGQETKAEEAYVAVLEAKPNSRCAKAGLDEVASKSRFEEAKKLGEEIAQWAILAGIALLAVLIVLLLLLRLLVVPDQTRHWGWLQTLLRLNLVVAPFDAGWMEHSQGPQFTSLFRSGFQPATSHSLTTATGHAEIDEMLKPLGEISAAKTPVAIASFLIAIVPRLSYGIGGSLQPTGARRQGVTVELTRGKRGVAIETIWCDEYVAPVKTGDAAAGGDGEMLQDLAVPAAAWAEYELASDLGDTTNLKASGSTSWALFRAGSAYQRRAKNDKAAPLYRKALEGDPANAGALANLGYILWTEGKTDEAEALLKRGLHEYENGKGIPHRANPDWYRAKFNLAGLDANLGAGTPGDKARLRSAHEAAREIVELGMGEVLKPRKDAAAAALRVIEEIVMAALTIYAATSVGPHRPTAEAEAGKMTRRRLLEEVKRDELSALGAMQFLSEQRNLSPTVLYNAASARALLGQLEEARKTLEAGLAPATEETRKRLAADAIKDSTLTQIWVGEAGEELEDKLREWAGLPLNNLQKLRRKMGCFSRH